MNKELALEKFGIVNDETGEVEIDRLALKKAFVERGVYILKEIDVLKGDLKEVVSEAEDDHNINKSNLSALIKHSFKNRIDDEIEKLEDLRAEINNLFGEDDE